MQSIKLIGKGNRAKALPLALGVIGLAAAGAAGASCPGLERFSRPDKATHMVPAVYYPQNIGDEGGLIPAGAPIVGLWKVEFLAHGNTSGIPDGALIDFGTATWHDDGTEEMVSGGRAPSTGDVCMGVWRQVGRATFSLTHLALAWGNGAYLGPAIVAEKVTLDPTGNAFRGTFTITQYSASAAPGHEFDESTVVPLTPIVGYITGARVTPN